MIPSPARIAATRRWARVEAGLAATAAGLLLVGIWPTALGSACAAGAAIGAGGWAYASATRIIRRRTAVLARPFPPAWEAVLQERVAAYRALRPPEAERFRQMVAILLAEVEIRGVGCAIDDTVRLLVAASAVLPVLSFPAWEYTGLRRVLVRPEVFDPDFSPTSSARRAIGMVGSGLLDGVVVLSLPELLAGFAPGAGHHHVGIHEFAHLIDQADGAIDGVPALLPRACLEPWTRLVHEHLELHAGQGPEETGIPAYGYTSPSEFFAVVSEYFFQSPQELAQRDPSLYALLETIFQQDLRSPSA